MGIPRMDGGSWESHEGNHGKVSHHFEVSHQMSSINLKQPVLEYVYINHFMNVCGSLRRISSVNCLSICLSFNCISTFVSIYLSICLSFYLYPYIMYIYNLYVFICLCLSLSTFIYRYLSLSIVIYLYLSLSIFIYIYLYLFMFIYLYLPLSIFIYLYLSLSIFIYLYLSFYPSIYPGKDYSQLHCQPHAGVAAIKSASNHTSQSACKSSVRKFPGHQKTSQICCHVTNLLPCLLFVRYLFRNPELELVRMCLAQSVWASPVDSTEARLLRTSTLRKWKDMGRNVRFCNETLGFKWHPTNFAGSEG